MAHLIGVPEVSVEQWEAGVEKPYGANLKALQGLAEKAKGRINPYTVSKIVWSPEDRVQRLTATGPVKKMIWKGPVVKSIFSRSPQRKPKKNGS